MIRWRTFTLVSLLAVAPSASADPPDEPAVGFTCDQDAKAIRLNYLWRDYPDFELPEATEWLETSTLVTVLGRDTERPRWKEEAPVTRRCTLGAHSYLVSVEAHIYNYRIMGRCGGVISAAVSIRQDQQFVLTRTPFREDCFSDEIISEIVFYPEEARIVIRMADHREREMRPNNTVEPDARRNGARGSP
jgi:hypothetical protein